MATWAELHGAEPVFADRVRQAFDTGRHKTMATLRRDRSPRMSGIEVEFVDAGICFGTMPGSAKARDLERDPRVALHSPTVDPPADDPGAWLGEAKLAGRAVATGGHGDSDPGRFVIDIVEVVLTRIGSPPDHLVIESWHPGRGLERTERR
ncbi:MAG TPA: pyridoxamine 5'-phosphate oxidase family protein [Acidimicrobiales bacterium]|nr:pyridoxamine 5'-phosphate oxidase family protein [Acidimicrobiales bacterium]